MANHLKDEQSLYLLQHAHNPVNWYPWGDEAFGIAKAENKPVLVSIGYAACHWCHVMERESFEDEAVAAYMNDHFINIKVDREERPEVDHMYMDAVQMINGQGGWPLNVFVTPDKMPFYGGTYFPPRPAYSRPSWLQLLERMNEIWHTKREDVDAQSQQLVQHLRQASQIGTSVGDETWDMTTCRQMADTILQQADKKHGGFGNAPKFPGTMAIGFLLEHYHFTGYEPALKQALLSLDGMIEGGIYDQLGGGFARYSTDVQWLAPHFEKMLYDNALLINVMCDAYSITGKKIYANAIRETIAFIERELKDPTGGYYSALDADSEGEEGKFYTWTWEEWVAAVGEDDKLLAEYFGITQHGNWEETNILHVAETIENLAAKYSISREEIEQNITHAKKKLFAIRSHRERPLTDDKCLLAWNALMHISLLKAGVVLDDVNYLKTADDHMRWMLGSYYKNDVLTHVWKDGKAKLPANLDDYAYLIQALIQYATATGKYEYILTAEKLTDEVLKNFANSSGKFFFYTSNQQEDIPVQKTDLYDGALPSANAVMAHNLSLLGLYMERGELLEQGYAMLQYLTSNTKRYTLSFAYWAQLQQRYAKGLKTVVVTGSNAGSVKKQLMQNFLPHASILTGGEKKLILPVLIGKDETEQTLIFVCTQNACLSPVVDIKGALKLINS